MYLIMFEKSRTTPLPWSERRLAVAVKRLSRWFSFEKLYEEKGGQRATFLVSDGESLEALKALFEAYGYEAKHVGRLDSRDQGHKLLSIVTSSMLKRLLEEVEVKRSKRALMNYAPLISHKASEKVARMLGVDISVVERARKALNGLVILALKVPKPRPEAFYALGYPFFVHAGLPVVYMIPLGRGVEKLKESKKVKVPAKNVRELASLILEGCMDSETLEQLSRCAKAVAQRYHASWRALLKRIRAYKLYLDLLARVLVKELAMFGVEVAGYELWKVRARATWSPGVRRLLLDLLAKHPELPVKEACRKVGISYSTAYRHLKNDEEYKRIMAERHGLYKTT